MSKIFSLVMSSFVLSTVSSFAIDPVSLMKREIPKGPLESHSSKDGLMNFKSEGKPTSEIKLIDAEAVSYYYSLLNIGTDAPVECFFYKAELDPALGLSKLRQLAVKNVVRSEVSLVDAGAFGSSPYLRLDTTYDIEKDGTKSLGYLKSIVAESPSGFVMCSHLELGYRDTFKRIVSDIVSSFSSKAASAVKPLYTEIMIMSLSNTNIGYNFRKVLVGKGNTKVLFTRQAQLLQISDSEIIPDHEMGLEISAANGILQSARFVSSMNGSLSRSIELQAEGTNKYSAKGILQGKEVSASVQTKSGLVSSLDGFKKLQKKFIKEKGKSLTYEGYVPKLSPLKALPFNYVLKKKNGMTPVVQLKAGELSMTCELDSNGTCKAFAMPMGPSEIQALRIYNNGAL